MKDYALLHYELWRKDTPFKFTDESCFAFRKLVDKLADNNVLLTPDIIVVDEFIIECDDSGSALGAALRIKVPPNLKQDCKNIILAF